MEWAAKSKGFLGTWKACLSEHSQGCAETVFCLSLQSGEIYLSQDLETDHWPNLLSFLTQDMTLGHWIPLEPLPTIAGAAALENSILGEVMRKD